MKKTYLISFLLLCLQARAQIPYNPFLNNIHYSPEPSSSGFLCGTINYVALTGGITTTHDAPNWQTEPLKISICIEGFSFYGPASTAITGTYATNFDWVYDSINPNCVIGTQNQLLHGTGSDPMFPNTLASGTILAALVANGNFPSSNILKVTASLIIPPYMMAFNSTPDDVEISETQTFFSGTSLSSAGTITGSKIFCASGDPDEFLSLSPASGGQSGNFIYQWQVLNGTNWTDIPGATNLTYDAPLTYANKDYRRNARGTLCDEWLSTDSITIIIDSLSIVGINAGSENSLNCLNNSQVVGSPAQPGNSYTWMPASGLSSTTIAQPLASPLVTTTYTLHVVDSNQCSAIDTVRLEVINTSQSINAGADNMLTCIQSSDTIGPVGHLSNSYSWQPSTGLSASNIAQPIASPGSTTTYTLTVIDSNGCNSIDAITVFVNQALPAEAAGPDKDLNCSTPSSVLGVPSVSGNSYLWSPSSGLSASNVAQPIASPITSTTYTVTIIDSNGCMAADQVLVNVDRIPPFAGAGQDQLLNCHNPITMIGSPAQSGNSYTWSPSLGLDSSNIAQPNASPAQSTSYLVTVTGANGCTSSDTVDVTIDNAPPFADAGETKLICSGSAVSIGTPAIGSNTYLWNPNTGLNSNTMAMPTAYPASDMVYTVTVTGANGCSAFDTVSVFVSSCLINISGNVFHDTDAMLDYKIDGIPMNAPGSTSLHVCLSNAMGMALRSAPVANDGTFQFLNVMGNQTYEIRLSSVQGSVGNPAPMCLLPQPWIYTGDDCCDQQGDDGFPNGMVTLAVELDSKTNIDFGINAQGMVLPVRLKNFFLSEYQCGILLSFILSESASLSNVDIYRRESNQSMFHKISSVQGTQQTTSETAYSYLDLEASPYLPYDYQLKFVDLDGKFTSSDMKSISITCDGENPILLRVFPNPASEELTLFYQTESAQTDVAIHITDGSGKIIRNASNSMHSGVNLIPLNIRGLPSGTYHVRIVDIDNIELVSERFIKK